MLGRPRGGQGRCLDRVLGAEDNGLGGPHGPRSQWKRVGLAQQHAAAAGSRPHNALELQAKGTIGTDLKFEQDLARWFPVWGAPGV